jgi:NAD(P)-dependent dehydrogenase (short-subunit alcohol dehydrogenase family)
MSKVWFITGATRGIGAEIAKAALAAGDRVVATARDPSGLAASANLLPLKLDVTDESQARAAVQAAVAHFGGIDVLVNNAGYGQLGVFETISAADIERQYATNVFGLFNVTRAVLPTMRAQRRGHVFNISSIGGLRGSAAGSIYCSTKFAVEGFSEGIAQELQQFGVHVTIVEPGFFRTDFLDSSSVRYGDVEVEGYGDYPQQLRENYDKHSHQQAGDPAKLGTALVRLANEAAPPLRFGAGTDAIEVTRTKIAALAAELDRWQALSASTDGDFS